MNIFQHHISRVDSEVSIKSEDRQAYTQDFDTIRNYLLDIMCTEDLVFKKIYGGPSLFGSYPENLRLHLPDEFDVHFLLKLPYYEFIEPIPDVKRPGFVRLQMSKVLAHMKKDRNVRHIYNTFIEFVNDNGFLCRNMIQHWLEDIINKALQRNRNFVQSANRIYTLCYSKAGTAHTIKATSRNSEIKIDFVPAFKFDADKWWPAKRSFPTGVKEKYWFAVPKPTVGPKWGRFLTFSICVPQTEKYLLTEKYNLKSSLRLFKSLRNRYGCRALKSYFIRSIYLHENDVQSLDFWRLPAAYILLHMIDKLLDSLYDDEIPFYWNPEMNLVNGLKDYQISKIINVFEEIENILKDYYHQPNIKYNTVRRLFDLPETPPLKKEYL